MRFTFNDFLALRFTRWLVRLTDLAEAWWAKLKMKLGAYEVHRIAVVGDLSMQDPKRLNRVLKRALASADIVVQLGDCHPAYQVVSKHLLSGRLWIIPGNHDDRYDSLHEPRQWVHFEENFTMVGLDNSHDVFNDETWQLLKQAETGPKPILVFAHKPISPIVLQDGSVTNHVMGESGNPKAKADAQLLQDWMRIQSDCLLVSGHWHNFTFMKTEWGDCIVDGRGGACPDLAFTLLVLTDKGLSFHQVLLD